MTEEDEGANGSGVEPENGNGLENGNGHINGRFVKGDPRINRKGRPHSFDMLRALALEIAHEVATVNDLPLVISGHKVTVAEAILRSWARSGNWQKQRTFMEVAFGKVPDELKVQGDSVVELHVIYDPVRDTPADAPSEAAAVHPVNGEAQGHQSG